MLAAIGTGATGAQTCDVSVPTSTKCKNAWDATKTKPKANFVSISSGTKYELHGTTACPQSQDICSGSKFHKITKELETHQTSLEVKITKRDYSCSYIIESSCESPYVQIDGSTDNWDQAYQDKLTYTIYEYEKETKWSVSDAAIFRGASS